MDPNRRSVIIEVMTVDESVVGGGRFSTDTGGVALDAGLRSGWGEPIERFQGIGWHIATRLFAERQRAPTESSDLRRRQDSERSPSALDLRSVG